MRLQLRVERTARRNDNDAERPTMSDEPCGKHPVRILFLHEDSRH